MKRKRTGESLIKANLWLLMSVLSLIAGCGESTKRIDAAGAPMEDARLRWGAFFGSPFGMHFTDPERLGRHRSGFGPGETNGMLYTCRGGFIDVGHVREGADRTAFAKDVVYRNLMENKTDFSLHIIEPSKYMVTISYPEMWQNYSQAEREAIANEISIDIGQYLAHSSLIWHEIITWYGFATVAGFPDKISSFSWEDSYSDLMGTCLAAAALREAGQGYDDAMTRLFNEELKELGVQPAAVARRAAKKIKGDWYTGGMYFFVNMKMHNFDVGHDDGMVSPVLVPGICEVSIPKLYPAPKLGSLLRYGFGFSVEMEPQIGEKNKIYNAIKLDKDRRIMPNVHFTRVIEQIREEDNMKNAGSTIYGYEK